MARQRSKTTDLPKESKESAQQQKSKKPDNGLLRAAGASIANLMAFQAASKLLTFGLNTALLRLSTPEVLGLAGIRLDLMFGTILYLSRDALRMALLRMQPKGTEGERTSRIMTMGWLAFPLGLLFAIALTALCFWASPSEIKGELLITAYRSAVLRYCAAALIELGAEPAILLLTHTNRQRTKLMVEMTGTLARVIAVLAMVLSNHDTTQNQLVLGLEAFSRGQLTQAFVALGVFWTLAKRDGGDRTTFAWDLFDWSAIKLALELKKQLFLKYALAQGDMWLVGSLCQLDDQGVYSVVTNYGSLVCRLVLAPMEEASLSFFSRTLRDPTGDPEVLRLALKHLQSLLRCDTYLALGLAALAPWYCRLLVRVLLGATWASTPMPTILALYCGLQLPLMAYCGILEAFLHSTISESGGWFRRTRRNSLIFSAIYVTTAVILIRRQGTIGLVLASSLSFGLRTWQSWTYLQSYLRRLGAKKNAFGLADILPPPLVRATLIVLSMVSALSSRLNSTRLAIHLAVGVISALFLVLSIIRWDRAFVKAMASYKQHSI